jgi:hypothetical protein
MITTLAKISDSFTPSKPGYSRGLAATTCRSGIVKHFAYAKIDINPDGQFLTSLELKTALDSGELDPEKRAVYESAFSDVRRIENDPDSGVTVFAL